MFWSMTTFVIFLYQRITKIRRKSDKACKNNAIDKYPFPSHKICKGCFQMLPDICRYSHVFRNQSLHPLSVCNQMLSFVVELVVFIAEDPLSLRLTSNAKACKNNIPGGVGIIPMQNNPGFCATMETDNDNVHVLLENPAYTKYSNQNWLDSLPSLLG